MVKNVKSTIHNAQQESRIEAKTNKKNGREKDTKKEKN